MLYVAFVGLCRWAPSLATGSSPSLLWTSWTAFMKAVRGATPCVTQLLSQDVFNTNHHTTQTFIKHSVTLASKYSVTHQYLHL